MAGIVPAKNKKEASRVRRGVDNYDFFPYNLVLSIGAARATALKVNPLDRQIRRSECVDGG